MLKDSHQKKEPLATDHHNGPGLLPLVTVPKILLLLVTVSMAAVSTGWLESLLSLYLTSQFSLSLSAVGFCFLLWSVVNTAGEDSILWWVGGWPGVLQDFTVSPRPRANLGFEL